MRQAPPKDYLLSNATRMVATIVLAAILVFMAACTAIETTPTPDSIVQAPERTLPTSPAENEETIKVLFIGNSYTFYNDLPEIFKEMMIANSPDPEKLLKELELHPGIVVQHAEKK